MHDYQQNFIRLALANNALCFGEFTLKSGRISPYFFNAGLFCTGRALTELGRAYANVVQEFSFDCLFGPAYKGISLAVTTATALANHAQIDCAICFNRKEKKDHGEGGQLVGCDIRGKNIVIVDDVITAGTAIRESLAILTQHNANLVGIVVSLDRQERGQGSLSAIQEIERDYKTPVRSIITLSHLLGFVAGSAKFQHYLPAMEAYHADYGITAC